MRKSKIRDKLLIINLIIILFIFLIQYIFQNIFFDSFYKNYKENELKNSIKEFEKVLYNNKLSNEYISKTLDEKEILLTYLDENLQLIKGNLEEEVKVSIKNENNEIINLTNDDFLLYENILSIGDFIEIDGYKYKGEEYTHIKKIKILDKEKKITEEIETDFLYTYEKNKETEDVKIKGEVVYLKNINQNILDHKQAIMTYIFFLDEQELKEGRNIFNYLQQNYIMYVKRINSKYIISSVSLENSNEVIGFLNIFNIFIILITLILAISIIYIYSKQITKPLLKMEKLAKSIAQLDFDKKIYINSKDELQSLSESLNNISTTLNNNINMLKEANIKLKEEYEERLNTEKSQKFLLINISHDLKTPLTIIKGYLKAIKDGIYNKDEYIDYTIESVDEISNTLNEMLEISRLKSKSYSLNIKTIDLARLIYKTYDKLRYLTIKKNQSVLFNLIDDAFVNIDEKEIKKVLENLITNSIKYSPNNTDINIDLIEDHSKYIFSIENEGVHIPEKDIKNVFKEFYRVDKSRNKKVSGNGFGLVIVKSILEKHKIKYKIENSGKGVKFSIYFNKQN